MIIIYHVISKLCAIHPSPKGEGLLAMEDKTAVDGAEDYVDLLKRKYPVAFSKIIAEDPKSFVQEIKDGGYFSGDAESYERNVVSIVRKLTGEKLPPKPVEVPKPKGTAQTAATGSKGQSPARSSSGGSAGSGKSSPKGNGQQTQQQAPKPKGKKSSVTELAEQFVKQATKSSF